MVRQTTNSFGTDLDLTFQFKLARELGMTVGQLTTKMSSKEYNNWVKFYNWEAEERNKVLAMQDAENKKRNK